MPSASSPGAARTVAGPLSVAAPAATPGPRPPDAAHDATPPPARTRNWRQRLADNFATETLIEPLPGAPRGLAGLDAAQQGDSLVRTVAWMVGAALVISALYVGRELFVPFALAALFVFLLDPFVLRLRRCGLPRGLAIGLVVLTTVTALLGSGAFVANQIASIGRQLPTYQATIQQKFRVVRASLAERGAFDGVARVLGVVEREVDQTRKVIDKPVAGSSAAERTPMPVRVVEAAERPSKQVLDWLMPVIDPLVSTGIVLVFTIFMLLERTELRDRVLRLVHGDLPRTTDALNEAASRVSRYLGMQLLVNGGYGIPMALGLWWIGVPGALLWGMVAAVMRFIPYVGPVFAAVPPLLLAFAVDPGWSMLLWTAGLIATLELLLNNLVEPLAYGRSTGISPVALMMAAAFWTSLWGPIGLILSTPLTVCLVVLGRHLPPLRFLDILLSSDPVFDPATRMYQRLLAGGRDEALELALEQIRQDSVPGFYNDTLLPALRLAAEDLAGTTGTEHRHRVASGVTDLLAELREEHEPAPAANAPARVLVLGARREFDALAAEMLTHALQTEGIAAQAHPALGNSPAAWEGLALDGIELVCISSFHPRPQAQARLLARRLRRRRPGLEVVLALWQAAPEALGQLDAQRDLEVDAVTHSLREAVMRIDAMLDGGEAAMQAAPTPTDDAERLAALHASGLLDAAVRPAFDRAARRAAEIFGVRRATITLVDQDTRLAQGVSEPMREQQGPADGRIGSRATSLAAHAVAIGQSLVVPDLARDPRFAGHPEVQAGQLRFYAAAPLRSADGHTLGVLALEDERPRTLLAGELRLLEAMATDLVER